MMKSFKYFFFNEHKFITEDLESTIKSQYPALSVSQGIELAKYSPTFDLKKVDEYVRWILTNASRLIKKGGMSFDDVLAQLKDTNVKDNISQILKNKKAGKSIDINTFKTDGNGSSFKKLNQEFNSSDSDKSISKISNQTVARRLKLFDEAISKGMVELKVPAEYKDKLKIGLLRGKDFFPASKVFGKSKPNNISPDNIGADEYGNETAWCTTNQIRYYNAYTRKGPLLVFLSLDTGGLWQGVYNKDNTLDPFYMRPIEIKQKTLKI